VETSKDTIQRCQEDLWGCRGGGGAVFVQENVVGLGGCISIHGQRGGAGDFGLGGRGGARAGPDPRWNSGQVGKN